MRGRKFGLALLEIKLATAMLLRRFEIEAVDTPDDGEAQEVMTFAMNPVGLALLHAFFQQCVGDLDRLFPDAIRRTSIALGYVCASASACPKCRPRDRDGPDESNGHPTVPFLRFGKHLTLLPLRSRPW